MTDENDTDGGIEGEGATRPLEITYDVGAEERRSEAVVRAVAAVLDASPLDLDPLYGVIDPDHVDETFERAPAGADTRLTFAFNGCEVAVTEEEVHVRSREAGVES